MNRPFPFSIDEFKALYSQVPRLCVDLVVMSEQGVLLLLRQKHGWEGMWHFPGGTVYYQEGVTNAVHRIAEEELGIKVKIIKFYKYMEFDESIVRGYGNAVSLVFICQPLSSDFTIDDNSSKAEFFKVPPQNTIPEHSVVMTEAIESQE